MRDIGVTGVQTCALPIFRDPFVTRRTARLSRHAEVSHLTDPANPTGYFHRCASAGERAGVTRTCPEIGRASCRERSVDLGGRRIIKKKKHHKRPYGLESR